jgi:hypothetical protein
VSHPRCQKESWYGGHHTGCEICNWRAHETWNAKKVAKFSLRPSARQYAAAVVPSVTSGSSEDFKIDDAQFARLEEAGNVKLSDQQRTSLITLGIFWIDDLRLRRTARPKQFSECFDKMIAAFSHAEEACRLNEKVGSLERHLLHWAMETPVKGANAFPITLAALEPQIKAVRETVVALKNSLPLDPGRQRPFDDERRIISLADIFEAAGGNPTAYLSEYSETGSMADTPFRSFAHRFYTMLPADDKRDPGGLDKALRLALKARRMQRRASARS